MEIVKQGTYAPGGYNRTEGGEINPMQHPGSRAKVSKAKVEFWAGKSKGEKAKILSATQTSEVRKRATETNRARALERAQAKADKMGKEEGVRYMEWYKMNSERNRAKYQAKKLAKMAGSSV